MKQGMKKTTVFTILMLMLALSFAACSKPAEKEESTGMPNPWKDVDSAEAAAEGADIDALVIADGIKLGLGDVKVSSYRCMDGMIEAVIDFPASQLTVRKGRPDTASEEGDISGDYNDYSLTWSEGIESLNVKCQGNRDAEAIKTIWQSGDYLYSINAEGLGGDEDFGLSMDDLAKLVSGIDDVVKKGN